MDNQLTGKRVGIIIADGVDAEKLSTLTGAIENAGGEVTNIAPGGTTVRSWHKDDWGDTLNADQSLENSDADRFDCLIVPGGAIAADKLRENHNAVSLIRRTIEAGRPLAVIGHGAWLLVETELVAGMSVTGAPSIQRDLRGAGAFWSDEPVVVDQGVVTVRRSADLDEALPRIVEEFAEGRHERPGITDVVSEASMESFPASDAPSWAPGETARRDEGVHS